MNPSNGDGGPGGSNNGGPGGPNDGGPNGDGPNNGGGGPNGGGSNNGDGGPNNNGGGGANNQGPNYYLIPSQNRLNELADYVLSKSNNPNPQTLNDIKIRFIRPYDADHEVLSRTATNLRKEIRSIFDGNPPGRTIVSAELANKIRNARRIHTCCRGLFLTTLTLKKNDIITKNTRNTTNYSKTPVNSSTTQGGGKGSGLNTAIKSNEAWL